MSLANSIILRVILWTSIIIVSAFIPERTAYRGYPTLLNASPQGNADFEYQEMKILSQALIDQGVSNSQIPADKRVEIEGYCRRISNQRAGSISPENIPSELAGTSWQLAFSSQSLVSDSLPPGTNIKLVFKTENRLDYILEFTKTFGLKQLAADSCYTVDTNGVIEYTYENISCDVFGLTNINVGAFGLLKGRASSIQASFFDGVLLIQRSNDMAGEFFNVYARI
mmetsp:Transcript_1232/g.2487  ORF Transcript_1232/g.2487 Transcript_1232/m.2487 type:complete len:226 (-) Transcript_1232:177-854(-)|eukprot:CAMPEP_0113620464 /NCGR_PEP_ID=MMETSP0017_2-20120614/10432_1 /TAXON_ID=2856 /ORGANISM="Cylindrotheca closterium" /LENGTH=225 /DNA_ID=CAMNT_0000530137 /DNA_START=170 /DNA_END=847 /DNA_ORIENTATION=- /assembly_acc=CAM_ASM_000147